VGGGASALKLVRTPSDNVRGGIMKVHSQLPVVKVDRAAAPVRVARAASGSVEGERVVLSDTALFIRSLRETLVRLESQRDDVIETARADVLAGRVGSGDELDAAADALLATF
jgi:hypothetical protein